MKFENESIDISLHKVTDHKTSYIITLYYPTISTSVSIDVMIQDAFTPIRIMLEGHDLSLNDVSIYLYLPTTIYPNEVHELIFDTYLGKLVGNRINVVSIDDVSFCVMKIHLNMIDIIYFHNNIDMEEKIK